nr:hypothetical protein [uncultured Ruegeria sp.]
MTKSISSADRLIDVPDAEWATVMWEASCPYNFETFQLTGELRIADLLRLGKVALREGAAKSAGLFEGPFGEPHFDWTLEQDQDGKWYVWADLPGGIGGPWWSEEVTYRGEHLAAAKDEDGEFSVIETSLSPIKIS